MPNLNDPLAGKNTYDSSYFQRLWILIKNRKLMLFLTVGAFGMFATFITLLEIPEYTSEYQLQVENYTLGKTMDKSSPLLSGDVMSGKALVNSSIHLLKSDIFVNYLAEELLKGESKNELVLQKQLNFNLKLQIMFYRLGLLKKIKFDKFDITKLTRAQIGSLILPMIETTPDYGDKSVLLRTKSFDPKTAYLINLNILPAYTKATKQMNRKQIESSLAFYSEQTKQAEEKLDNSEDEVTQFLRAHPILSTESSRLAFLQNFNDLQNKEVILKQELDTNTQLYNYYKNKYLTSDSDSNASMDITDKLKQELIELKFRREVFRQKNYDQKNPGIIKLNDQITHLEEVIRKNTMTFGIAGIRPLMSASYLSLVSQKLQDLQDLIRLSNFNLNSVQRRIEELRSQVNGVLQQTITLNSLRREVEFSAAIAKDFNQNLQRLQSRAQGEDNAITAYNEPTFNGNPINLPAGKRIFFACFLGFAIVFSIIIVQETISPKVVDRYSAETTGIHYAGYLDDKIANQAEVLSSLGCLEDAKAGKGPRIILCASPKEHLELKYVNYLTKYLSKHKRKSLTIVISDAHIPEEYLLTDDMGYAKIYRNTNGFEDVVKITDPDTFSSMRSLLDQFGAKYHVIFIFVAEAISNLGYHMAQRIAKQLVLFGGVAEHSTHEYLKLIRGFLQEDENYIVLIPPQVEKSQLKELITKHIYRGPHQNVDDQIDEIMKKAA